MAYGNHFLAANKNRKPMDYYFSSMLPRYFFSSLGLLHSKNLKQNDKIKTASDSLHHPGI